MRGEQFHAGEVESASFEYLQNHGKAPQRARHRDAVVGLLLGEGEDVPAVSKERTITGAQVHVASIELGEVGDEEDHRATLAGGEIPDPRYQLGVGKPPEGREKVVAHACL